MGESLRSQTVIGFSTAPEAAYNTNPVTANLYTPMVTRVRDLPVPDGEKVDDRGVIGRGNSMYPTFQRSGFQIPTAFELSDMVNAGTFMPWLRRYMGKAGTTPTTVEASVAFKHTFYELDPSVGGLQLPSTSIVYSDNEYDYLHTGVVPSTLQLSQQGTQDPSFTEGIVGSGQAKRIATVYPSFGSMALPPQDPYMYGASSAGQYTDDASTTASLTTPSHKLRGLSFSANNNLILDDTRMGMPQVDVAEPRRGWYRDFLHFGDREISAEFTMGMDGDYAMKNAQELNLIYTNFTWTMNGDVIPSTAAGHKYEVKLIIPKFYLRTPRTGEDNQKDTKTFSIFPVINATHYGLYRFECVNGVSTAIQ